MAIVKELFSAYLKSELPLEGGYIIASFFDPTSTYSRYEVTSYNNVKDIYTNDDGLTFLADGKKLYVLIEPANYAKKHIEPSHRDDAHKIPYRFKEVELHISKRQDRIMIGQKPVITYASFTILKPTGHNFSYIFYDTEDLIDVIEKFFIDTIWKDANVPKNDAEKSAAIIRGVFDLFVDFKIE